VVFRTPFEALRAASAIRGRVDEIGWPEECAVDIRIAVHSGRWSGDPRRPKAATALYRLASVLRTAEPGTTLVSATTAGLVEGDRAAPTLRGLGERAVPNLPEPVQLFELVEP
jgi:class 3 adenylate cyclase